MTPQQAHAECLALRTELEAKQAELRDARRYVSEVAARVSAVTADVTRLLARWDQVTRALIDYRQDGTDADWWQQ